MMLNKNRINSHWETRKCIYCQGDYTPRRTKQKFCTLTCQKKFFNRKYSQETKALNPYNYIVRNRREKSREFSVYGLKKEAWKALRQVDISPHERYGTMELCLSCVRKCKQYKAPNLTYFACFIHRPKQNEKEKQSGSKCSHLSTISINEEGHAGIYCVGCGERLREET